MKHPLLPVAALAALLILVCEGCFGLFTRLNDPVRDTTHFSHHLAKETPMLVRIVESPTLRHKSMRAVAHVLQVVDTAGISRRCSGKILLYLQLPADIAYGDTLLVLATPEIPTTADNPHQFDYRRFLARKGIHHTDYLTAAHYRIVGRDTSGILSKVHILRQRLVDILRYSSLTPSQQGIAEALFLGSDENLDPQTESHFRHAGITHLLCVSGLHVGIVAIIAGFCLSFLSNRSSSRILKGLLQLTVIWFFVLLTGMAPGTMRAGLMFSFITVGQMFFSKPPTLNAIAASALVLLVCRPLLLFDVGFQLSYCSVIAIVTLVRPLEALLPLPTADTQWAKRLLWPLEKLRSLFCVSLVAQLATTQLILYYFHQFPPYFLVANITVLPCAGLLLAGVLLLVALAWWPWAFALMGKVVSCMLSATEWVTSTVARWPHSMIEGIWFDQWMFILAFIIVAALACLLLRRRPEGLALAIAAAIAITVYDGRVERRCSHQLHYDIYNLTRRTAIECFAGKQSYLVCDSITAQQPQSIDFQTSGNLLYHRAKRTHVIALDSTFDDGIVAVNDGNIIFAGKLIYQPKSGY